MSVLIFIRSGDSFPLLSFPPRRSSDLAPYGGAFVQYTPPRKPRPRNPTQIRRPENRAGLRYSVRSNAGPVTDRKSTRLNSSHLVNSYAVFCLKTNNK